MESKHEPIVNICKICAILLLVRHKALAQWVQGFNAFIELDIFKMSNFLLVVWVKEHKVAGDIVYQGQIP